MAIKYRNYSITHDDRCWTLEKEDPVTRGFGTLVPKEGSTKITKFFFGGIVGALSKIMELEIARKTADSDVDIKSLGPIINEIKKEIMSADLSPMLKVVLEKTYPPVEGEDSDDS
jgi:hypothetical protein